tara:strand:- start:1912 stop:2124 length:213 start_codon:yes stop_codon:yes gene_type:complete
MSTMISRLLPAPLQYFAAILIALLLLAGCGQSGPLYLPGNPSEVQAPSSSGTPAPPSERREEEEDEKDKG